MNEIQFALDQGRKLGVFEVFHTPKISGRMTNPKTIAHEVIEECKRHRALDAAVRKCVPRERLVRAHTVLGQMILGWYADNIRAEFRRIMA